jgi:acyl-CoA synthetase (NDP forming)
VGGSFAEEVIRQSRRLGFPGQIWAVNPNRESLLGVSRLARLEDLADAVFLDIGREETIEAVDVPSHMGAGGAVAYASSFAEVVDGVAFEQPLKQAAGDRFAWAATAFSDERGVVPRGGGHVRGQRQLSWSS